jgi:hypothetical protein
MRRGRFQIKKNAIKDLCSSLIYKVESDNRVLLRPILLYSEFLPPSQIDEW